LSGLFAAARVTTLQTRLQRLRLLYVLRGLLLIGFSDILQTVRQGICFGAPDRLPTDPLTDEEENNVALKLTQREVDGVTVVALDGRIVLGDESNALREKVKSLLVDGKKSVVLNMDNITFIDSAGLGTLVASHHTAKKEGASLRLCHLGSKFQEVLQITKLLTVFEVYDTEAAAVASFSK